MDIKKWLPDRKVLSAGVGGIIAFAAATAFDLEYAVILEIVLAVIAGLLYLVPPSVSDIIKRVDDTVKKLGGSTTETVEQIKQRAG